MIKCVIFDLDDTLYDYSSLNKTALTLLCDAISKEYSITQQKAQEAFEYGRNKTKTQMPDCAAVHNRLIYVQKMLEYLGKNPVQDALKFYDIYWNHFLQNMVLREGVYEFLEKLRAKNIQIGLCTDLTAHIQHRKIMTLRLVPYVDFLVTSEEAGCEKPNKRIFDLCLEKANVVPQKILFIGDSLEKDVKGAKRSGMNAILFDTSKYNSFAEFMPEVEKWI